MRRLHFDDPRDKRLAPVHPGRFLDSHFGERNVLIDTTPDFRQQALRSGIQRLDAILFTHSHADHIMGLDDVRPFNFRQGGAIPIYGSADTIANVQSCFRYIFDGRKTQSSVPRLVPDMFRPMNRSICMDWSLQPIRLVHGRGTIMVSASARPPT